MTCSSLRSTYDPDLKLRRRHSTASPLSFVSPTAICKPACAQRITQPVFFKDSRMMSTSTADLLSCNFVGLPTNDRTDSYSLQHTQEVSLASPLEHHASRTNRESAPAETALPIRRIPGSQTLLVLRHPTSSALYDSLQMIAMRVETMERSFQAMLIGNTKMCPPCEPTRPTSVQRGVNMQHKVSCFAQELA